MPISGRSRAPADVGRQKLYPRLWSAALAGYAAAKGPSLAKHVVPISAKWSERLLYLARCVLFFMRERGGAVRKTVPVERMALVVLKQKATRQCLHLKHVEVSQTLRR